MTGLLRVFIFSLLILGWNPSGFAQTRAFTPAIAPDSLDADLDQAKAKVEQLKDDWDKARLETTLYNDRAQRQYSRWVKASKKLKAQAQVKRDRSELELILSVEERKLAYSRWQEAQLHETDAEIKIQILALHQGTKAIQDQIQKLESKLKTP